MLSTFVRGSGLAGAAGSLVLMVVMFVGVGGNGDKRVGLLLNALSMLLLLVSLVSQFVASRKMSMGVGWAGLMLFVGWTRVLADITIPLPAVTVRIPDPSVLEPKPKDQLQ